MLKLYDYEQYCNFEINVLIKEFSKQIEEDIFKKFKSNWCTRVAVYTEGSKLSTYKYFMY